MLRPISHHHGGRMTRFQSVAKSYFSSLTIIAALGVLTLATGCTGPRGEVGTEENPLKLFFVPSVDANLLNDRAKVVQEYLEKKTPYKFKVSVPSSYIAVVEAFGTKRADIAALNTFGYILANERFGTEALITVIRYGQDTYKAQIVAKADGTVKSVSDINGKKFAFVDPASTSGYLLPAKLFMDKGVSPSETVFAQKHDNVITMVYQGQVDAGATFYSPPEEGKIQDARRLVKTQFPDVEKKIKIIELTEAIPNDPIVFRKDLPAEVKTAVVNALLEFVKEEKGKETFHDLYGVTALKAATDKDYDGVRQMLTKLGKTASDLMKK